MHRIEVLRLLARAKELEYRDSEEALRRRLRKVSRKEQIEREHKSWAMSKALRDVYRIWGEYEGRLSQAELLWEFYKVIVGGYNLEDLK
jgi:hypothetical protein